MNGPCVTGGDADFYKPKPTGCNRRDPAERSPPALFREQLAESERRDPKFREEIRIGSVIPISGLNKAVAGGVFRSRHTDRRNSFAFHGKVTDDDTGT